MFAELYASTLRVSETIASAHAGDVDAKARFPAEALQALREARLLAAPVPRSLGGPGCNLTELARICAALAHGCGSSAMVLAMHFIQVACLARHHADSRELADYLRHVVEDQPLLASMTSEVGTFGDTRSSICALERQGERFRLAKDATTGSYCGHADAIAVTCRRDEQSPSGDQRLVLVLRNAATLTQTTSWDTLGMRGTCSPGFRLEATGPMGHVLPDSFADISAQTMVPFSHILWSALWWGIASDAVKRAAAFVRGQARKAAGTVPAGAHRLAAVTMELQTMRQHWMSLASDFDAAGDSEQQRQELSGIGWALRLNNLKISCSEAAPRIVHGALQIAGIPGYKNDSPFSLGRHYRDVLSASLMISNERIGAQNASMLLILKEAM